VKIVSKEKLMNWKWTLIDTVSIAWTVVMIIAKLIGATTISWIWVFSPIWILVGIGFVIEIWRRIW